MKKKTSIVLLVSVMLVALGVPVLAASGYTKQASLNYNDIKITLNGAAITPKDANGNTVEPFIIDGTTYLPVRAVAEAIGLYVNWDGDTNTVKLSSTPQNNTSQPSEDGKNHDIDITGATLDYEYGIPRLYLDFKNNTNLEIKRLDIYIVCADAYGNKVGTTYSGYSLNKISANGTDSQYWDLLGYSGTQTVSFGIYKYITSDDSIIEIAEDEIKWWKTSY